MLNSGFSEANWEREIIDIGQIADAALKSQPGDQTVKEKLREAILAQSVMSIGTYLGSHLTRFSSHESEIVPGTTTDDDCIPVVNRHSTLYHGFYTSGQDSVELTVELSYGTPFYYTGNRHPAVELSRLVKPSTPPLGLVNQAKMELEPIVQQVIQEKCGSFLQGLLKQRRADLDASKFSRPGW